MTTKHIVIGLGGTGGRILCALRKRIFQDQRGVDNAEADQVLRRVAGQVAIEWLYVDSSRADLNDNRKAWRVLGTSVELPAANKLYIRDANLKNVLDNRRSFPGIDKWLGAPEVWNQVPSDVVNGDAGGQRRRLGRFLFAHNSKKFREAIGRLTSEVNKIQLDARAPKKAGITYHLLCGLAGGTGSGSIVDAIAQVGNFSTDPADRILVYCVLPERVPESGWDSGNYHANGYAALKEINGLLVKRYRPWDVLEGAGPIDVGDKIKCVYVITRENALGQQVGIANELPEIVSDFMFEKLVAGRISGEGESPFDTAENSAKNPETVPGTEEPERARKFMAFGVRRVAVPEEEIREYLTYSFARQASAQLRFANWNDAVGFVGEPPEKNYRELAEDEKSLERWRLTDAHLTCQVGILEQDRKKTESGQWQNTFEAEWRQWSESMMPVIDDMPLNDRFDEVEGRYREEGEKGFRNEGVARFLELRISAVQEIARQVRALVETDLFDSWKRGERGMVEVLGILTELRKSLERRRGEFEQRAVERRQGVKTIEGDISAIRAEYASLGLIMRPVKGPRLYREFKEVVHDRYVVDTELRSLAAADRFIRQILTEIQQLETEALAVSSRIQQELEEFEKDLQARVVVDAKNADTGHIVKYFDPALIRETVTGKFLLNKDVQDRQVAQTRDVIFETKTPGKVSSFRRFNEELAGETLRDRLSQVARQAAEDAHSNADLSEKERLIGVSILRRLREQFGSNEEALRSFVADLVDKARYYARIDDSERAKDGPEVGVSATGATVDESIIISYPNVADMQPFMAKLQQMFRGAAAANVVTQPRDNRPNELVVVSVLAGSPVRFFEIVKLLNQKYRKHMDDERNSVLKRLELHTEDEAKDLPDLFAVSGPPANALALLFLAETLAIVRAERDARSGKDQLLIELVDRDGIPEDPIVLPPEFARANEAIVAKTALRIKREVNAKLAAIKHVDEKAEAKQRMLKRLDEIKRLDCEGSSTHPFFKRAADALREANKALEAGAI